jgi:hypothetical protein
MKVRGWSLSCAGLFLCALGALCGESSGSKQLDPAAWGGDHVGKPVPEYAGGDTCLFCHRADVGPGWPKNRHQRTTREPEIDSQALAALKKSPELTSFAGETNFLLGTTRSVRFLKKNDQFGKLDLLSAGWHAPDKLDSAKNPHWDNTRFGDACAGCHTTAVDSNTRSFSALSLDCYACHGEAIQDHTKDTSLIYLAKKRHDPARVVISICAQCHVRTGKSKGSGLPYPNNFQAGDNLFRDFQVDLSLAAIQAQNPADRHVLENIRDVVLLGKEETTCLSCHDVHKSSTKKHHRLLNSPSCLTCHEATGSKKVHKSYEVHSPTCEY